MSERPETLERIAEAVSDGAPVDWESESSADREVASNLRGLRLVESVASAHRRLATKAQPENADPSLRTTVTPPSRPAAEPEPVARWGPLELLELLGQGGFGEVWRARDPKLGRDVALKLRRRSRAERDPFGQQFLDEARRLARVRHENVLVVHGADEHDGRQGLWAELVEGKNLEQCLEEQGTFGAREAVGVGIDVCRALAAVHAAGLIHRDVKTTNVMREKGGKIVLMDFGSVTEIPEEWETGAEKGISGTPVAMAPEALGGDRLGPSADIYSVGVLLYRLVSSRYPVEARTLNELREKHRNGEAALLRDVRPDVPAGFVQVVERALSRRPEDRQRTAGAMEKALAASIGTGETAERPALQRGPARQPWRRWAAAAAAVVVMAGVAYVIGPSLFTPPAFEVESAIFREGQPGEAGDVRLATGGRVRPGDKLYMEVQGSEEMHVYVLNEDEMGRKYLLFPLQGLETGNPVPGGMRQHLPGVLDGEKQFWVVTSAGGTERFLLVASRDPVVALEQEIASYPEAKPGHPIEIASGPKVQLRGVGGVEGGGRPGTSERGRLSDFARGISAAGDVSAGIHVELFELDNPAP